MRPSVLALALLASPVAVASAQPRIDLGTVRVPWVEAPRPAAFSVIAAPAMLDVEAGTLPEVARAPYARWLGSERALHARLGEHARRMRERAPEPDLRPLRAELRRLEARHRADAAALLAVLDRRSRAARSREEWWTLGRMRLEAAQYAFVDAAEAEPQGDPGALDGGSAIDAFSQVEGSDALAAHASFFRGYTLAEMERWGEARAAFEQVLAMAAPPSELRRESFYRLGDMLELEHEGDPRAREAFARAAADGPSAIGAVAAHRAAFAFARDDPGRALELLAPILDHDLFGSDARTLAAHLVARAGPDASRAVATLPAGARIAIVLLGARRLTDEGATTWASAALDAIEPLAREPATRAEIADLRARITGFVDDPAAWLRRAARWCAMTLPDGRTERSMVDVVARIEDAGRAGVRIMRATPPGALRGFTACLERSAPPPDRLPRGEVRARLELAARDRR